MGYTHYWEFKRPKQVKGNAEEAEKQYQLAVRQCQRIIRYYNKHVKALDPKHPDRLAGYSAHCKVNQYGGIDFNGTGDLGHENFVLREHFSQCFDHPRRPGFNFCKTARKPYDRVVVACLATLKHYLGDLIDVDSDGDFDDWFDGVALAKEALRIKSIENPIEHIYYANVVNIK